MLEEGRRCAWPKGGTDTHTHTQTNPMFGAKPNPGQATDQSSAAISLSAL